MKISARAVRWLAAVACAAASGTTLALVVPASAASQAAASGTASTPVCTAADLGVWVAADQTDTGAGTAHMQLEFTNLSHGACTLRGFPGVSALGRNIQQLGSPADRDHTAAPTTVKLAAGGTAHALLEYSDVVTGDCPSAAKRTAFYLRIYPPGQNQADHAFWDLPACTAPGSTHFLDVGVIAPGPGVRAG